MMMIMLDYTVYQRTGCLRARATVAAYQDCFPPSTPNQLNAKEQG